MHTRRPYTFPPYLPGPFPPPLPRYFPPPFPPYFRLQDGAVQSAAVSREGIAVNGEAHAEALADHVASGPRTSAAAVSER